jgi:GTPase SAR1 family protein
VLSEENKKYKTMVEEWKDADVITPEQGPCLESLYKDPAVQQALKESGGKSLYLETLGYWMEKLDKVVDKAYIPVLADVLKCRAPTTGIVEGKFHYQGLDFTVIDVGGQRNERKKWIHSFSGVTSLIYVFALSAYNEVLYEANTVNAMQEALSVFEKTVNLETFERIDVILFMNKSDLFREKLKTVPITEYFKDYTGSQDFDQCVQYIRDQYRSKIKDPNKELYAHVTCATDTSNVDFTFAAVTQIILNKRLSANGFLP